MKLLQIVVLAALMLAVPVAAFDAEPVALEENAVGVTEVEEKSADDVKGLANEIPSYAAVTNQIRPRNRFVLWDYTGIHVMWGVYGNNYFTGKDNLGKKAWGIYYAGDFYGFYGKHFFYGRYAEGNWKARGIFGMRSTWGQYVTFPALTLAAEPVDNSRIAPLPTITAK